MGKFSTAVTYAGLTLTAASSLSEVSGGMKIMLLVGVVMLSIGTIAELFRAWSKP